MMDNKPFSTAWCVSLYLIFLILVSVMFTLFKVSFSYGWDAVSFGLVRSIVAGVGSLIYCVGRGEHPVPSNRLARRWLMGSTFAKFGSLLFVMQAMENAPANFVGIITAIGPLIGMLYGAALFKDDRLNLRRVIGLVIAVSGVAMLAVMKEGEATGFDVFTAIAYSVGGTLIGAWMPTCDKKALYHGATIPQSVFFSCAPVAICYALCVPFIQVKWPEPTSGPIMIALISGVIAIVIFAIRRTMVKYIRISSLMLVDNAQAAFTIAFASFWLGEALTLPMLGAMAVVLAGVSIGRGIIPAAAKRAADEAAAAAN